MAIVNQKEYLKKYLSIGSKEGKKKKRKKKVATGDRVKIIDDDIDISNITSLEEAAELFNTNEDAPQVVGVIDERPMHLRIDDYRKSDLWRPLGGQNDESNVQSYTDSTQEADFSPPRRQVNIFSTQKKKSEDYSPARIQNKEDRSSSSTQKYSDESPPRGGRKRLDSLSPNRYNNRESNWSKREHKRDHSRNKRDASNSPPQKNRLDCNTSPQRRHDVDDTPPRRSKRDSDSSPSKITADKGPPQRNRRGSGNSPPRKQKNDSYSPQRRNRQDSDESPPRKKDFDISPPRRSRWESDNSPPRRRNDKDNSPPRRHRKTSDSSPPRKKDRKEIDSSPPRRNRRESNNSPPRKRNRSSSPPRFNKNKQKDLSPAPKKIEEPKRKLLPGNSKGKYLIPAKRSDFNMQKMTKTLDGKTAGLQNAQELVKETQAFRQREDELFKNMSTEISGANAVPILRDRKTGKIRDLQKEAEERKEKEKKDEENKKKYTRWGRGIKQVEDYEDKLAQDLHEMSKPLARYADDEDLEKFLKEQEREGDPMLDYIRKKKKKKIVESGKPLKPQYEGEFNPNRFGIVPGYRWDGVDRSNGYEKQWFQVQNAKRAQQEEIYKWSTEDM